MLTVSEGLNQPRNDHVVPIVVLPQRCYHEALMKHKQLSSTSTILPTERADETEMRVNRKGDSKIEPSPILS